MSQIYIWSKFLHEQILHVSTQMLINREKNKKNTFLLEAETAEFIQAHGSQQKLYFLSEKVGIFSAARELLNSLPAEQ